MSNKKDARVTKIKSGPCISLNCPTVQQNPPARCSLCPTFAGV